MGSGVTNICYKAKQRQICACIESHFRVCHWKSLPLFEEDTPEFSWFSTRNKTEKLLKTNNRSFQALCVKTLWNRSTSLWHSRQGNFRAGPEMWCLKEICTNGLNFKKEKNPKPYTNSLGNTKYTFFLSPCPSRGVLILFYTHRTHSLTSGGLWCLSLSNSFLTVMPKSNKNPSHKEDFHWNLPSGEAGLWLSSQVEAKHIWGVNHRWPETQVIKIPEIFFLSWKSN